MRLALIALLLIPAAQACVPCGSIVPLLDIALPDQTCGGTHLQVTDAASSCPVMFADGESITYTGTVVMEWDVTYDGTYPKDLGEDLVLNFRSGQSNPSFLDVHVEPAEFRLDDQELLLNNYETRSTPTGEQVWFHYERPVTITLTRDGEPTAHDLRIAEARSGHYSFFLALQSSDSGGRFVASTAQEEFRFSAAQDIESTQDTESSKSTPGPSPLWLVPLAALLRRP